LAHGVRAALALVVAAAVSACAGTGEDGSVGRMEIAYGDDEQQVVELGLPEGEGPFPVAVLIHGGFWRLPYDRTLMNPMARDLESRGWATWNVDYRRVGSGGGVPQTLDDVTAALAALRTVEAPLDLTRVVAIGHSAGGQLALWAAGGGVLTAAVGLGAVADLGAAARDGIGSDAAREFAGDRIAEADPVRRLPVGIPLLLVHGSEDDRVPVEHARSYVDKAHAAGDDAELLVLPDTGHFEPIDTSTDAWSEIVERLEEFRRP
jgi:acetyl esterase/lipase